MKIHFNQLRMSSKFMLVSSVLIATVVLSISFFVNKKIEQLTEEKVNAFTQKLAVSYASVIDSKLEDALSNSKLLAQMFALFAENKQLNFTREDANLFLKEFIETHPEYTGVTGLYLNPMRLMVEMQNM
jgi:type VI protein secretion system component VasK